MAKVGHDSEYNATEQEITNFINALRRDNKVQEAIRVYMKDRRQSQKDWLVDRLLWIYDED